MSGPKASTFKVRTTVHGTFRFAAPDTTASKGLVVQALGAHGERASVGVGLPNLGDAGVGDVGA
jgi:hypothetical protein